MATLNTIRTVSVRYQSEGADRFRSDAQAAADAQTNLAQATEQAATITDQASRRQLSAASAFDRVRASVDASYRAQQALERATRTVDRAFQQGAVDAGAYAGVLEKIQTRYNAVANAAENAARAEIEHARAQQNASTAQFEINRLLGVDRMASGSARMSAAIFEEAEREREAAQALIDARQQFIAQARAQQQALTSQFEISDRFGFDARAKSARDSASVFEEMFRQEAEAQKRLADMRAATARATATGWRQLGEQGSVTLSNVEASRRLGMMGAGSQAAGGAVRRGLRSDEITNLTYQGSDIAAQLGSGAPLGMIAMQQGPQIAQIFAGPGGASVKGAFAQARDAAAGLAARVGIAGGAIGGLTAAAVAVWLLSNPTPQHRQSWKSGSRASAAPRASPSARSTRSHLPQPPRATCPSARPARWPASSPRPVASGRRCWAA